VAHICNPSYSGGRDQEDRGSKPAQVKSSIRLYLKKPSIKIGLVEWLKMKALSSSPSTSNNNNKTLDFSRELGGGTVLVTPNSPVTDRYRVLVALTSPKKIIV
jgi:hypothetical protein